MGQGKVSRLQHRILVRSQVCYMRKFRFGGDLLSIPSVKSESGVVQSSLKQRTWLLSAQGSVPPSKVQLGRIGIPGDFSVLEVPIVEDAG